MAVDFAEFNRRDREKVKTGNTEMALQEQPKSSGMSSTQKVQAASALASAIGGGSGGSGGETSSTGGALKGAASGAASAAALTGGNPYAMAVGAAIGGITGAMGARAARKRRQAQAEADKHQALAGITQEKGARINQALNSMAQAFGSTLKQNKFLGRF